MEWAKEFCIQYKRNTLNFVSIGVYIALFGFFHLHKRWRKKKSIISSGGYCALFPLKGLTHVLEGRENGAMGQDENLKTRK